ncbi:MAG: M28 family peptidase [Spirochaetaceae bacterium]|nr:M28 family peptidase [Spirochaetaceae bacterium]
MTKRGPGKSFSRFEEFIAPGADRFAILGVLLKEAALPFRVLPLEKSRHLFVHPDMESPASDGKDPLSARNSLSTEHPLSSEHPPAAGDPLSSGSRAPKTVLVAHYDRAEGSPGANDNSAAVFMMIESAKKLLHEGEKNWGLIFTDHEEVPAGGSLEDQGSFALARFLRDRGFAASDFFIFDCCGTGDTLIISTTAEHLLKEKEGEVSDRIRRAIHRQRAKVLETSRRLFMDKTLLAPTPFSDDPGFLQAGIAAQTITCLPASEASALAQALRLRPELLDHLLVNRKTEKNTTLPFFPPVWRRINGPGDQKQYLTPEYFNQIEKLALALCRG